MSGLTRREIEAVKDDILSAFHCALPGIVEAFDPASGTASVRPALCSRRGEEIVPMPLLTDVPVFLPAFSEPGLSLSVSPGDACLLVFSDAAIDGWFESGKATLPPSGRQHDLSDAFAFVGFRRA